MVPLVIVLLSSSVVIESTPIRLIYGQLGASYTRHFSIRKHFLGIMQLLNTNSNLLQIAFHPFRLKTARCPTSLKRALSRNIFLRCSQSTHQRGHELKSFTKCSLVNDLCSPINP